MARVLLVDDEPIVRRGIAELLEARGHEVVADAGSATETFELLDGLPDLDLAVVDLALGDGPDGIQLTKGLVSRQPSLGVVLLSGHEESLFAERALQAGAAAYVMKDAGVPALLDALDCVLAGRMWLSDELRADLTRIRPHPNGDLGTDAATVLDRVRAGSRGTRRLMRELDWSLGRVERALTEVLVRLRVPSEVALYLWADGARDSSVELEPVDA